VSSATWTNWSREVTCRPARIVRPRDSDEVAAAVRGAAETGHGVRVAGAGHSFTPLVATDGVLLRLDALDRVLDVDREHGRVRVQAGIRLRRLADELDRHGLAMPNLGDIDVQSLAGAIATGTHGTGAALRPLHAQVEAIRLVAADGTVHDLETPEELAAARVALGALGVVTEVTVRCVPAFTLRGVDAPRPLADTLARLDELADGAEHFELFAFPHANVALTRTNTRVDDPPAPPSRARALLEDVALTNGAFGAVCRLGRARPSWIPALNRFTTRAAGSRVRVDRSDRVFATPRLVKFVETEWAIPRAAAREVAEAVLAAGARHAVNFPIELRFAAADDALLSPAHGRPTAFVAAHVYRGMPHERFFDEVQAIAVSSDGRPHWGKRHALTAAELAPRYPGWTAFHAVRARLDPDGRFANPHLERVLGPSPAAARQPGPTASS
jgi:L-gulono-1,4-lactone dehydrogenase